MQDLRSFEHLQHEGGLRVGQIVGGADAGVDGVNRSEPASRCRHIAPYAGQQHHDRDLAHIGRLAAHIGAGDDLHALLGTQPCVVGNESTCAGFIQAHLHHRMPARFDFQAGLTGKLRRTPVQCQGALAQGAQRVQRGQGTRQLRQARYEDLQLIEQFLKQILFPGQGALLGAQGLVFKSFQLRCDEAFCVLQRLAAPVVGGHLVKLALCDLDEKAVHLVVLHAQIGNAGAGPFARLDVQQKGVGVALNRAQLIEFSVKPAGDHAAVAQQRGGFGVQCAAEQSQAIFGAQQMHRKLLQVGLCCGNAGQQKFGLAQGLLQCDELTRAHLTQRQTRRDAFHVAAALELLAQWQRCALIERPDGAQALLRLRALAPG